MAEGIDPVEARAMILMLSGRPHEVINYETLKSINPLKRHRLCLLGLLDIQKRFFFMIKPEQVNHGIIEALDAWRLDLIKDDDQFGFWLKNMLPDTNSILNLKRFTVSLIAFIESIKADSVKAFNDYKSFEQECLRFADDPELKLKEETYRKYIYGDFKLQERKFSKLKTTLAPVRLVNGFAAQDKILIDPVEEFVYSCFQFHTNYPTKSSNGHFSFEPRFKHTLSDLLFEMKRTGWITSTNDEIIELIVQLIPGSSRVSLRKYSSPGKKISPKHSIELQLFN